MHNHIAGQAVPFSLGTFAMCVGPATSITAALIRDSLCFFTNGSHDAMCSMYFCTLIAEPKAFTIKPSLGYSATHAEFSSCTPTALA